jgi:hypothetical protein
VCRVLVYSFFFRSQKFWIKKLIPGSTKQHHSPTPCSHHKCITTRTIAYLLFLLIQHNQDVRQLLPLIRSVVVVVTRRNHTYPSTLSGDEQGGGVRCCDRQGTGAGVRIQWEFTSCVQLSCARSARRHPVHLLGCRCSPPRGFLSRRCTPH